MVILTFIIATRQVFGQFFQRGQFWLEPVLQPFFTICVNLLQSDSGLHRGQLELLQNRLDAKPKRKSRQTWRSTSGSGKTTIQRQPLSILICSQPPLKVAHRQTPIQAPGWQRLRQGERIPMIRHSGTNRYATTMACVISSLPCFDFQRKRKKLRCCFKRRMSLVLIMLALRRSRRLVR